jgi:chromosome segregation ATPase
MSDDESFNAYDQNSAGFQVKLDALEQENRTLGTAKNYSIPQMNYENLRKEFNDFKAYTESKLRKIENALEINEHKDTATTVSQSSFNSVTDTSIKLIRNQLSSIEQKTEKFDSELKDLLKSMEIDFKEKISSIDSKNKELNEMLEDLEENSKQNDNKIEKVSRDSTEHGSKIENLDKDLHKVNRNISEMETKQTQLSSAQGKNKNSLNRYAYL